MNLFDRHRPFRQRLSEYIDGTLSLDSAQSIEAHLESCDLCRRELEELRAAVMAVRDLPALEPPRSFILTPQQVARPARPPLPANPPLATGMRLAGAALTVALAVVLFADFRGSDTNQGGGDSSASRESAGSDELNALKSMTEGDSAPAAATDINHIRTGEFAGDAVTEDTAVNADNCDEPADAGAPAGVGGPVTTPASPEAAPLPSPAGTSPSLESDVTLGLGATEQQFCAADNLDAAAEPTAGDFASDLKKTIRDLELGEVSPLSERDDDGLSTLRWLEIGLAAALGVILAGIAITFIAGKSRRI